MDNKDRKLKDALLTVIFKSLLEIDDIDNVCVYNFDLKLCNGTKIKGNIEVVFEEVE